MEASWPTGGVDAPTLPGVQGHQDKAIKTDVADIREVMPHCVVQVIQSYYKHYLACTFPPSFLGLEAKVSQSRGGSLQRF